MLKNRNSQRGFTLIETAIVIMILSLIIVPLFKFMAQEKNKNVQIEEENKLERITVALVAFVKQNNRYPCPARPIHPIGHDDFGQEYCTTGSGITLSAGVRKGFLPVETLRLPYHLGINRHGWKYMYAVTAATTGANQASQPGVIDIEDAAGADVIAGKLFKFVIIDPGKDGKGSYSSNGALAAIPCSTALDTENCNAGASFIDTAFQNRTNQNDANYYDDKIVYTFAREESSIWQTTDSGDANSTMDVVPRMDAAIGVGTTTPNKKLQVGDAFNNGDMNIRSGNLMADDTVYSTTDVTATDVTATGQAISPVFYYD